MTSSTVPSSAGSTDTSSPAGEMKYWEDLATAPPRHFGPLDFSSGLLEHLLDLMGEKHPIHDDAAFAAAADRPGRIVPGGFIHSITSGWTVQHGSAAAIIGMRSMNWSFLRPLPLDTPFYFTTETSNATELSDRAGLVNTVRKVTDGAGATYAIGRLSVVVLRRPIVGSDPDHREDTENDH
jgi:acyl dehydratase